MPPRHVYWTIILEGKPTAFRAHSEAELLPTFKQLQSKHPDVVMKWFSRGRLWSSPDEERAALSPYLEIAGVPVDPATEQVERVTTEGRVELRDVAHALEQLQPGPGHRGGQPGRMVALPDQHPDGAGRERRRLTTPLHP